MKPQPALTYSYISLLLLLLVSEKTIMSTTLKAPFTCIIAGPTGCGKTRLMLRIIKHADEMIEPKPTKIVWCYGIYQQEFDRWPEIEFREGLPTSAQDIDPGSLLILDDLMAETDSRVMDIFTRSSHHRAISCCYLTQNIYYAGKHNRTMNLNTHYLFLFKNPRDGTQIQYLSRQIFPHKSRLIEEAFRDATSNHPHQYLFLDLKNETDDKTRVRSNIFPDDAAHYAYVPK